jgi:penicillin-binding protein A
MKALQLLLAVIIVGLLGIGLAWGDDGVWLIVAFASVPFAIYLAWSVLVRGEKGFERNLQKLASVMLVGFLLVSVHLVRQQVVVAKQVRDTVVTTADGIIRDPRLADAALKVQRGRIFDARGNEVAGREVSPDGYVKRTYLNPAMADVIGYYSPTMYGNTNLEQAYDEYLNGEKGGNPFVTLENDLLHRTPEGNDLYLTLDPELQQIALNALGNHKGAAVLLDPKTGAILAMVSNPAFDPGSLAFDPSGDWTDESARIKANWDQLLADPDTPLLNRATQGLYPPGSTFKTITAAAGLDTHLITPSTVYTDTGELMVEGHQVLDPNRPDASITKWSVTDSYKWSLNAVFAQIGLQLGPDRLQEYAHRFGFDSPLDFDLPTSMSQIANDSSFLQSKTALADTAYGQGQILVTPLQMALVAATVANGGEVPHPYLVSQIKAPDGSIIQTTSPRMVDRAISTEAASQLKDIMVNLVGDWFSSGALTGVKIGGKTGTAQVENGNPHAWFIAFAPAENPRYALAVVLENAGEGHTVAAPVAKTILEAAIGQKE